MAFRPHPVGKVGETSQRYAASATSFLFALFFFVRLLSAVPAPAARLPGVTCPRRNRYAPMYMLFLPLAERAFHFAGIILGLGGGALIVQLFALANAHLQLCSVLEK